MDKVTKILLIIIGLLLFIYFCIKGFDSQTSTISGLVGSKIGGGELSVSDYYYLSQCIETYRQYILEKDYDSAYKMLNTSYKDYFSFDNYKEYLSQKNYSIFYVKAIEIITPSTFKVLTDVSGDSEIFSIIIGNTEPKSFILLPDSFLDYKKVDKRFNKKKIDFVLEDYIVKIDKTIFNFRIKNNSEKEQVITGAELYTNLEEKIINTTMISIPAKESKKISIEFKTNYEFPIKLLLKMDKDEYSVSFDK